ncbi:MAG: hypothetical protein RLZZ352_564 [Pseudomonadota bacterium]|jgi:serine/threonine-protein kinase
MLGAVLVLCVLLLEWFTGFMQGLDNRLYDWASLNTHRAPAAQVVVLAVDDASIAHFGRWPWSREVHAQVIDRLTQAGARTVVHTSLFFEPQQDRGVEPLKALKATLATLPDDPLALRLNAQIDQALQQLDADAILAQSMRQAGQVLLPLVLDLGQPLGRPDVPLPPDVQHSALPAERGINLATSVQAYLPLPLLGAAAARLGHLTQIPDAQDAVVRADQMLIDHHGSWIPSLGLQAAAHSLNLMPQELMLSADGTAQLGGLRLPLDASGRVWTQFYPAKDGKPAFTEDSLADFMLGKIPAAHFNGKIVIIGATAAGVGDRFVTPLSPVTSPATLLAHTVSSYLSGHFFERPHWRDLATLGACLLVGVLVAGLLPRLKAGAAAWTTAGVLLVLVLGEVMLVTQQQVWVSLTLPAAALVLAYLGLTTRRFWWTEAGKLRSDQESAETSRLMGLAHQGQGQLDLAFDRFRRVPMSEVLMENLSQLALDFERKRQFNKAQAVYEYMAQFKGTQGGKGSKGTDNALQERLNRVKQLSETVMLGGHASRTNSSLVLGDAQIEKPMLGRYQIDKELGKGAMGVVYLGRDPKIGRVVAIKTMALAQAFDGPELDDARARFFREAETAGRLQHQHIVTIFDAGEDQELAYIAMEFLHGHDLAAHTQPGQLLPPKTVVQILIQVAQALDYAHRLHVVHRDIKPANIMFEASTGQVKVTDFGIARITDVSRTRTGMVLGTPSFMSPEQIAGQKVDGRSDLYSLGVTAYQLLTGTLPHSAASIAELMYKITQEPVPDVRSLQPTLPAELARVVARTVCKDSAQRYQTGNDLAADLAQCLSADFAVTVTDFKPTQPAQPAQHSAVAVPHPAHAAETVVLDADFVATLPFERPTP